VVAWHEYLKKVLRAAGQSPVGLLIHYYNAGVDNESIAIVRRAAVNVLGTSPTLLQALEPDVLYEFS
jgi:hypothetical protein